MVDMTTPPVHASQDESPNPAELTPEEIGSHIEQVLQEQISSIAAEYRQAQQVHHRARSERAKAERIADDKRAAENHAERVMKSLEQNLLRLAAQA